VTTPPDTAERAPAPADAEPVARTAATIERPVALPRTVTHAQRLPSWMGSIRLRLTVLYSSVLCGLAALLVGVIYYAEVHALNDQQVYKRFTVILPVRGGFQIQDRFVLDQYREIERLANERALEVLRQYSFAALVVLFAIALVVGWFVSGRVLRPIGQITDVAKEIQATDLSRRIELGGPHDELRELADTFDDMLERIDDAFESQREFIHEASHELRNPLAVIRTNLDVTLSDPGSTEEDLRHTLEVVQRSSERMTRLVDDLLVYARKGSLSMERQRVDVGALVHETADEFRAPAEAKGITLADGSPPDLIVEGDRHALRQALANLLANAIRLSPEGTTIRVRAGREAPWIWMSVEDEGPGIAPEDQDRVFQRFWRGDPREGREEGRSGLGLTIVRQIAEAHGGEVKLASTPGHGAAFALWLPADEALEAGAGTTAS
jgi:signal transduction histidine kinase